MPPGPRQKSVKYCLRKLGSRVGPAVKTTSGFGPLGSDQTWGTILWLCSLQLMTDETMN